MGAGRFQFQGATAASRPPRWGAEAMMRTRKLTGPSRDRLRLSASLRP